MLAVAWRSFIRHYLVLVILCIAAGFAGALLPVAFSRWVPALSLWGYPLGQELAQISLAILVVTPALVLLSQSDGGQEIDFRGVMARSGRRAVIVVLCQAAMDAILVIPAHFILPRLPVPLIVAYPLYLVYEIPLLAFNYMFLATLAAESTGPLAALGRTFQLLRGQWWRMYVVAFILWLASVAIIIVAQYAAAALGWSQHRQILIAGPMAFGARLLVVIPVAVAAYRLLRHEKDGPPLPETAQIFD